MAPLPRRQPWSSAAEFTQVFDLLFSSNGDPTAQRLAVSRLHAWSIRSPSSFPVSLAATASFVSQLLPPSEDAAERDEADEGLRRRLALSMAITRFVNGLVDPMQQGYYARSIGHIAEELGLPGWFVELRHRATHEDLPGEPVLLEAATQALDWLYARYWLPTLHSLSASSAAPAPTSDSQASLVTLLAQYKSLQKALIADSTAGKPGEVEAVLHGIEAWVESAAREIVLPSGAGVQEDSDNEGEEAALGVLVARLCDVDVLVPRSRKKRPSPSKPAPLPESLIDLYAPLLSHLASTFPSFASTFLNQLTQAVITAPASISETASETKETREEDSHVATIAGWMAWALTGEGQEALDLEDADRQNAVKQLLLHSNPTSLALLVYLKSASTASLPLGQFEPLLQIRMSHSSAASQGAPSDDLGDRLASLQARWKTLVDRTSVASSTAMDVDPSVEPGPINGPDDLQRGWTLFDANAWRPCPIGMLPGGVLPELAAVH